MSRRFRSRTVLAIVRRRAYWLAAAAHAGVLSAFLLAWGDGMPSLAGSVLEQALQVQLVLLAVILPWVAARCRPLSRRAILRLAGVRAQSPARLLMVRAGAMAVALAGVALAALPMLLLAVQVSAAPFSAMIVPSVPMAAMIPFVALLSAWCELLMAGRLSAWLAASGVTIAVALTGPGTAAAVFAAGSVLGVAALGALGNRMLQQTAPAMSTTNV